MPKLKCGVNSCANNAENCCCLGKIDVAGGVTAENTCCSSFIELTGATNAADTPNESLSVDCDAHDCVHNKDCQCCAESIDVAGAGACNCTDTQCSSFCHN